MKKNILFLAFSIFSLSAFLTVSCQKDGLKSVDAPLETQLANDKKFENTIEAATELGAAIDIESLSNESNIEELKSIAERINNKSASEADYNRVKEISGVSFNELIGRLGKFTLAISDLNKAYPQLAEMKQDEMSALFAKSIKSNENLNSLLTNPKHLSASMKAAAKCPLQDICKLAVTLTNLFAGNSICAAIGISIPIIGDIVCKLILTLGVGVLNGICGALPC